MKQIIDSVQFIKAWQKAKSVSEVTSELNISTTQACAKAAGLRKNGVKLKNMVRGTKDFTELQNLALSLLPENSDNEPASEPVAPPARKKRSK